MASSKPGCEKLKKINSFLPLWHDKNANIVSRHQNSSPLVALNPKHAQITFTHTHTIRARARTQTQTHAPIAYLLMTAAPSGVVPYFEGASMAAPHASSRRTIDACPFAAALKSAVSPSSPTDEMRNEATQRVSWMW